jgi:hypothetical protein
LLAECCASRWFLLSLEVLVFGTREGGAAPAATPRSDTTLTAPESPCAKDAEATPPATRRALAVGAAVVPGILVIGSGHWVNGQPCTARRLIAAEGVGLGAMGLGIVGLWPMGATRYLAVPASLLTMGGFSLIMVGFGADIYGVSGAARLGAEPEVLRPSWETEIGILRVYNPAFDFDWLASERVKANLGRASISAALDTALDGPHASYRLGGSLRAYGALPKLTARDGSYFDLSAHLIEQRFTGLRFVKDGVELLATGRLDLGRYAATLRGSFAEWSTGVQLSSVSYRINGVSVPADFETMLLGRFALGAYLGRGERRGSEAMFYYDHRRDDYAAGIKLPGYGNGMAGHIGLSGRYFFSKQFGVSALLETGSSHVAGGSLLFRAGGQP